VSVQILQGDALTRLREMPDESVHCCITSPPYWGLRDYGVLGQIGLEATPSEYVARVIETFSEVKRALRRDGTLWLNLGDSYADGGRGSDTNSTLDGTRHNQRESRRVRVRESYRRDRRPREDDPHKRVANLKPKDLMGIPWMVALALRSEGWYLRQDIIWSKPNPMPESVRDRCTKAHEYVFLLSKSERYYYDVDAVREPLAEASVDRLRQDVDSQDGSGRVPGKTNGTMKAVGGDRRRGRSSEDFRGHDMRNKDMERFGTTRGKTNESCTHPNGRNKRSVWTVTTQPFKEAHFATFPPKLIEPMVKAGCPVGGTVLDPFGGAGTTGLVADRLGRNAILIELNPDYCEMARRRIRDDAPLLAGGDA
jgi:DNA modification methylase